MVAEAWFNGAGTRLMTTTADGTVRVWELAPRELALPVVALEGKGHTAISPDGSLTASVSADGAVWVREASSGKGLHGPWTLSTGLGSPALCSTRGGCWPTRPQVWG